jgi:hypothetical protein
MFGDMEIRGLEVFFSVAGAINNAAIRKRKRTQGKG